MKLEERPCDEREVLASLAWLSNVDASTEYGLPENHDYIDLRGCDLEDLRLILDAEAAIYSKIEAEPETADVEDLAETIQQCLYDEAFEYAGLDFGVASAVVAVSAIGGIPLTSCNAGVVGGSHTQPAPTVQCYLRHKQIGTVLDAARATGVSLVVHQGIVGLFTPALHRLHDFASEVERVLASKR